MDYDGDVVSPAWMASAVKDFIASYPAIRVQHRPDFPAGKGLEAWQDDSGATWLKSLIVDERAKKLVRTKTLAAYSIGISNPVTRKSARAPHTEIVGGVLREVSLVDSPANARCGITVCKSRGGNPGYVGKAFRVKEKAGRKDLLARLREYDERFEKLAGLADPGSAPFTGVGIRDKTPAGQVSKRAVYDGGVLPGKAAMLSHMALTDPDPAIRQACRALLEL